ncbi:MAG: segregation/condensation protein A [Beijerinckiaceae bacterium]|nr:segregation/condensation protein A [Beijerinckiaceae bacterium]
MADEQDFEAGERFDHEPAFVVDVDGFGGPLDLLLTLARKQQVDLSRVSILALAEQYLRFIEMARSLRLELAADYLVMAAWLAYLKSRLLLPMQPKDDEPSAELLAEDLALRLQRLAAIRLAAQALLGRAHLGRDVFERGSPERVETSVTPIWQASMYDLLSAYADIRRKKTNPSYAPERRAVWSLAEARAALERLIGKALDWSRMDEFLIAYLDRPEERRTARASAFAASLELVREGRLDIRQDTAFSPIYVRRKPALSVVRS